MPLGPYVVAATSETDGVGGTRTVQYSYESLVVHSEGLGARGFLRIQKDDLAFDVRQEKTFSGGVVDGGLLFALTETVTSALSTGTVLATEERHTVLRQRVLCNNSTEPYAFQILELGQEDTCEEIADSPSALLPMTDTVRTTTNLRTGQEVASTRASFVYDDRGIVVAQTVQTGIGQDVAGCSTPQDCLKLTTVIHERQQSIQPLYPRKGANGEEYYGGLFHGVDHRSSDLSWTDPSTVIPAGTWYGLAASNLVADISTSVDSTLFQNHGRPLLSPSKIVEHPGTSAARETDLAYKLISSYEGYREGVYLQSREVEATSPAAPLLTVDGATRKLLSALVYPTEFTSEQLPGSMVEGPDGTTLTTHIDAYSPYYRHPATVRDENGLATVTAYDGFDDPLTVTAPDGGVINYSDGLCTGNCPSYAAHAVAYRRVTEAGRDITLYMDVLGRTVATVVESFEGDEVVSTQVYDAKGRLISASAPYVCSSGSCDIAPYTTWQYDDNNETVTEQRPGGGVVTVQALGRPGGGRKIYRTEQVSSTSLDTNGNEVAGSSPVITWTTEEDVLGNVVKKVESDSETFALTTEFAYDPEGRLVWSRIGGDDSTVVIRKYDLDGNLTLEIDPDAGRKEYTWSVLGELLREKHTGLDGTSIREFEYFYDALGRMVKRKNIATGLATTYTYASSATATCGKGMLCGIGRSDGAVSETFSYGLTNGVAGAGMLSGRTLQISAPNETARTFDFGYTYLPAGLPETVSYPDGAVIRYDYQNGYPLAVVDHLNGQTLWQANAYDAFGSPVEIDLGNGVRSTDVFDAATGRLHQRLASLPSASQHQVQGAHFGYDSRGRMAWRKLEDFQADAALPGKTLRHYAERFTHDYWNRLTQSETFDIQDGVGTQVGTEQYGYDTLGNVTAFPGVIGYDYTSAYATGECTGGLAAPGPHAVRKVGTTSWCYNAFGEVTSVGARTYTWSTDHTAPVGISEGTLSTTFLYGPEGEKRYQHSSDGTTSASRWFAGEGYELDVSGGVSTTRIYLGDFAVRESSGGVTTTRYTLRDHLGSVEVVLDGDATDGTSIYDSLIAYQSFAPLLEWLESGY